VALELRLPARLADLVDAHLDVRRHSAQFAADRFDDRIAEEHSGKEEAARRFFVIVIREQSRLRDALARQQVEVVDVVVRSAR
jgi:hypothetical protein